MAYPPEADLPAEGAIDEPVLLIRDETDGGTWRRTGHCCRCGECCVGRPDHPEMPAEGPVEGMCPLFVWLGDKIGHCNDRQHPYYLQGCVTFPEHPSQIEDKPGCTYRFERVD